MTTSIFQNVEIETDAIVTDIKADFQAAWAHIEDFYSKDVKPIIAATLQYVETNGASELLTIAKRVTAEALREFESGVPNLGEFLISVAGTIFDECKNAAIAIEEGAAHLAANMALTALQAPVVQQAPAQAPVPDPSQQAADQGQG